MPGSSDNSEASFEARLRRLEDVQEIANLIALHPPYADTGAAEHTERLWAEDAVFARSDGQGTITLADMVKQSQSGQHTAAMEGGMAHFCGHPFIRVDGDRAIAVSYLQLMIHLRDNAPVSWPGHGSAKGFFPMKVVANLWELVRTPKGWRAKNRVARTLDGSAAPRDILKTVFQPSAEAEITAP